MNSNIPDSVPNKESGFDDPRQGAIYDYLKRLVGEGAASFYKDACRHMSTKPPFETITHLVGHCLREIMNALCGVLEGITESAPEGSDRNKRQIIIILTSLGIEETDPIAVAWLESTDLHGIAHRNNLNRPRPFDESFQERWDKINLVLSVVLEKFETQYVKVFNTLDQLALKTEPVKDDVVKLKVGIPNNRVAHGFFFNRITLPVWLPMLQAADFFKYPPAPESVEGGGFRYPTWPILAYLHKVSITSPDLVTEILSEIPDTDNGNVKSDLIEIATKLPKEQKIKLIPHIKRWINPHSYFFNSVRVVDLIKSLAAEGEIVMAIELSGELLGFIPEPPPVPVNVEGMVYTPFQEPKTIIDKWQYARFLREDFPSIVQSDPIKGTSLLCELLDKYYDLERSGKNDSPLEDYFYVSRPSIEKSDHLHRDDPDDSLVSSIILLATNAIDADQKYFTEIISLLQQHSWPVFKRIVLYLQSKYPKVDPTLVIESLMEINLLDNRNYEHEYALLVETGFDLLSEEQKKEIFEFIDQAETEKIFIEKHFADATAEDKEKRLKMWQRDMLSVFDSYLEGEEKKMYEKSIVDLGQPDNPRTRMRTSGVFVGPVSDVRAEQIGEMSADEIVELLNAWEPKKNDHGFGPSREGLGRELGVAVKKDVARFATFATKFIGLDSMYVRSYLQPFSEVIQNGITFEWDDIIDLCLWVTEQPRMIEGRVEGDGFGSEDAHWGWTRRSVATLISHGLNHNVIPFRLREKVWRIIEVLSEDPNPTPEEELTKEGEVIENAYNLTINTVRGEAMTAVIEYGLWMIRLIDKLPEDQRPVHKNFSLVPGMKDILENHLTDPSVAVRAVYGRYFPWILLLDREWSIAHIQDIFPKGGFNTSLYDAAWETYIGYVSLYDDVFEVLRPQYLEAIQNIGSQKKEKKHSPNRDHQLTAHLMTLFWRSKLDMKDSDGILATFWKNANADIRGYAIDFIGRSLENLEEPLDDKEAKLLKELWEMRVVEAESATDKSSYEKEMSGFGWWFASGKFEENWSIEMFMRSLDFSRKASGDYLVIDRLVTLAESKPLEAIQILEKLTQRDRQQWILFGNESDLRSILNKALTSTNESAITTAKSLISRLIAWGYEAYSDLLQSLPQLIKKETTSADPTTL